MKFLAPSLVLTLLSIGTTAFAEETDATPDAASQSAGALMAPAAQPASATPIAPAAEPPSATPAAPVAPAAPMAAATAPSVPSSAMPVRPLLQHFAHQEALHRYGEGAMGLAGSGVLLGAGFVAAPHDSTWSTVLWVSSGVVALGSIGRLLVPSELEHLEQDSTSLSDEQLRVRWRELADARRMERRAGAVIGGLLGATSIVLGGLVLNQELGNFDDRPRRIVGLSLIASGALGIVENGVQWFVPSPIEVGAALATSRPALGFAVAPTRSGFTMAVTGAF